MRKLLRHIASYDAPARKNPGHSMSFVQSRTDAYKHADIDALILELKTSMNTVTQGFTRLLNRRGAVESASTGHAHPACLDERSSTRTK